MLVIARESRGLTQKELVDDVPNLNQGNYSKMEKGILRVPQETLLNIAKRLDYPESFFYKKSVYTPISNFYYRRRASISKKDLSTLEAKFDIIRITVDELLDSIEIPEYKFPLYQVSESETPSSIARKIREYMKLPRGPINNLVQVLEAFGILVYFIETDNSKFDGISLLTDKGQPIIFINDAFSNDRKRFNLAHELGHLILHIPHGPLPSDRDEEQEANEFAGEFLMPYLDCRSDLMNLRYSQLGILKTYWKVSKAAIAYRAKAMNTITSERYTNLNIELSKNGEKKKESGFVELDEPKLMNLIINAYENELGYTFAEILGLLGLNERDYFTLFKRSKHNVEVRPKKVFHLDSYLKSK